MLRSLPVSSQTKHGCCTLRNTSQRATQPTTAALQAQGAAAGYPSAPCPHTPKSRENPGGHWGRWGKVSSRASTAG